MRLSACIFALVATYAQACINDRDTLAFEIRNIDALNRIEKELDPVKRASAVEELALRAIGGRFERFPARYYQMRIERLERQGRLSAAEYDDLAVAYDRLGDVDKAIRILVASKGRRTTPDGRYRFHANYGTFLVHRWIKNGHTKSDRSTLQASIAQIETALKINPSSHFGRERVQLILQKSWLNRSEISWQDHKFDAGDQVVGLAGIAMMGLGYELPDIYEQIARSWIAGAAEESILGTLARARAQELIASGHPAIIDPGRDNAFENWEEAREPYGRLRQDGDTVHQARLAYMSERFDRGEHPDTNPKFWSEWKEPAVPYLQRIESDGKPFPIEQVLAVAIPTLIVLFVGLWFVGRWLVRIYRRFRLR
ncbi:MAG: hypothetical protein ACOYON_13020 [Fimbriimonas sp.]